MIRELQIENMIKKTIFKFSGELQGYKVILFGSRAKSEQKKGNADYDIGVLGPSSLPLKTFFAIEDAFDNLPTLYRIDWVDLNKVSNQFLTYALIDSKVIYE